MIGTDLHHNMLATDAHRIRRPATLQDLPALLAFVEQRCRDAHASRSARFDLRLAVEEVCVNAMRHGRATTIDIAVAADPEHTIIVTVADDGRRFDPSAAPPADTTSPWQERPLGGLGWHLVKHLMDDVVYEPRNSGNVVKLVKVDREVCDGSSGT